MNVAAKLAAFGVGLLAVLGIGVAIGAAFGPKPSTSRGGAAMVMQQAAVDGYDVELTSEPATEGRTDLSVTVRQGGMPVTDLSSSGGTAGRLVAIRVGDLAYAQVRPVGAVDPAGPADGTSHFETTLASTGTYRVFFEFEHRGVVRTAEFTLDPGATTGVSEMRH
jgi:hypothetical protein